MIRPDYMDPRTRFQLLQHSSEGSSWKKHKYLKRVDGTYYYPDTYEGGRHLPDGEKEKSMEDELFEKLKNSSDKDTESNSKIDLSEKDVEKLAKEVIRGNFGNGQERKDLLGENYEEIQKRVNELMKGSAGSKIIPSDKTKDISIAEEAAKKAVTLVEADRNKKKK